MGRASKLFPEKTARFTLHISSFERKGEKTKNLMFCRTRVNNLHIDVSSSSCHFARAIWRVHSRIHMTNDGKRMKLLIIFFFFGRLSHLRVFFFATSANDASGLIEFVANKIFDGPGNGRQCKMQNATDVNIFYECVFKM